jgi:hypothetical protein
MVQGGIQMSQCRFCTIELNSSNISKAFSDICTECELNNIENLLSGGISDITKGWLLGKGLDPYLSIRRIAFNIVSQGFSQEFVNFKTGRNNV